MDLIAILECAVFGGVFIAIFGGVWIVMSKGGREYKARLAAQSGLNPDLGAGTGSGAGGEGCTDLALARVRTARRRPAGDTAAAAPEADVLVTVLPENGHEYEATIRVQLPLNGDAGYRPGRMLVVAPATPLHPIAVVPIPPADWARKAATASTPSFV